MIRLSVETDEQNCTDSAPLQQDTVFAQYFQTLRQPLFRDTPIFADSLLTETRDRKNRRVFIVEPSVTKPVSKPDSKDDLKSLPMPEVEKRLGSSAKGLSQAEAQKRLAQYGPNEIKEKKDNLFLKFLSYFWGPIPWMIEGAVILSGVVKHWLDFFITISAFLQCGGCILGRTSGRQ